MSVDIRLERIYEPPSAGDGLRILVDRLWPRGRSKADAAIDHWAREVAPSTELRRWYAHEPDRWDAFRARYEAELADGPAAAALAELRALIGQAPVVTLLTATRDLEYSHVTVLRLMLDG